MALEHEFLVGVLGEDGAKALEKAMKRAPSLASALVPRAIVSWLETVGPAFEGSLPGIDDSYLSLQKNQDVLEGALTIGHQVYEFTADNILHVAAATAVALGIDGQNIDPAIRRQDLSKLGKSIDLLVKARKEIKEIKVTEEDESEESKEESKEESSTEKTERPGQAAPPQKQLAPLGPTAPRKQSAQRPQVKSPQPNNLTPAPEPKPAQPGLAAPKPLKFTKSEMAANCPVCGEKEFQGTQFKGCSCMQFLAKGGDFKVSVEKDGSVRFVPGPSWDREAVATLVSILKEGSDD